MFQRKNGPQNINRNNGRRWFERSNTQFGRPASSAFRQGFDSGSQQGSNSGSQQMSNSGSQQGFSSGSQQGSNGGSQQGSNSGSQQGFNSGSQQGSNSGSQQGSNSGTSPRTSSLFPQDNNRRVGDIGSRFPTSVNAREDPFNSVNNMVEAPSAFSTGQSGRQSRLLNLIMRSSRVRAPSMNNHLFSRR